MISKRCRFTTLACFHNHLREIVAFLAVTLYATLGDALGRSPSGHIHWQLSMAARRSAETFGGTDRLGPPGAFESVASSKILSGIEEQRRHKLIPLAGQRPVLQDLIVSRRTEATH